MKKFGWIVAKNKMKAYDVGSKKYSKWIIDKIKKSRNQHGGHVKPRFYYSLYGHKRR